MANSARVYKSAAVDETVTPPPEIAALHARADRAEKLALHQAILISMLAELLASSTLEESLDALAGALKERFACDRVAIALEIEGELTLQAVSQQAVLEPSSSEARLLIDAMHEACDQDSVVCWPTASETLGVLAAHRALAGRRVRAAICSVPMYAEQQRIGAILLERRDLQAFPVKTLERLALAMAPLLRLHRKADRSCWVVLKHSFVKKLVHYLGTDRPGVRLLCVLATLILAASLILKTQWQIVAPAELMSHERRLVTAAQAGFVADMQVAAGDKVTQGQVLARLDRREMELEAASRESDVIVAEAEFRAAISSNERQSTGIARARLVQARARYDSVKQRLSRTELVSPIDGLVTAADATRTEGTAVSRGETLFEIAPGTDFEVHVLVDEADVYDVAKGQSGMLSLRAMPGTGLPIVVESVHPVAEAEGGENRFRVKANLVTPLDSLRPGQSGVVRLDAGQMSYFGALTRRMNRRLAELWWRWIG